MLKEKLEQITKPIVSDITNQQILYGMAVRIPALDLLKLFSDSEFEDFIEEWSSSYLAEKVNYKKVYKNRGAGDKGRDIIATLDDKEVLWDCYQCKHYENPLTPSVVWVEFGKLCYYTYRGDYTIPQKYIFATSRGLGSKLKDLIKKPEKLKGELIKLWDDKCRKQITDTEEVILEGEFKKYVQDFDFSIISFLEPLELIEQHRQTPYYITRFGGGFTKFRVDPEIPSIISNSEVTYIEKLLKAYNHDSNEVFDIDNLKSKYKKHLSRERIHYHKALSLAIFERDTLPEGMEAFEKLKTSVFYGIIDTVESDYSSAFTRIKETTKVARSLQLTGNALTSLVEDDDKHGICHHLANDNKIDWVDIDE
ncbi:restriction endonuclease [Lysinibacillus sp. CNPSo 3705]|uniref:ABC-three component system protein n=1 Tax=Lysinibacillus sp. CNPSo 3705 TaxID=3028148 RepID=UPI002363932D|nr:ABC-three component system protein [Lysinibacillus sp. CNPSo 3705]MDD1505887.1 restriction endonuclease [Lysinibacillus sp. CNPSo 3705]